MKKVLAAFAAVLLSSSVAGANVASNKICDSKTLTASTTTDCNVMQLPASRYFSYQVYCNETTDDSMSVNIDWVGGSSSSSLSVPSGVSQLKTAYTTEAAWSSIAPIVTPLTPFGTIRFTENNGDADIVCSVILNISENPAANEDGIFEGNSTINEGNIYFVGSDIPSTAPTAAVNAAAGNLNGITRYRVTFVTNLGETDMGIYSDSVNPSNEKVDLTAIPTGNSSVIARRIYRQTAGSSVNVNLYYLVATISDNTTTTYTDNIADGSLGALYPTVNTTGGSILTNTYPILRYGTTTTYLGLNAGTVGTGYANTGIGAYALTAVTSGEYNTAIGRDAMKQITTGYSNVAVGTATLYTATDGYSNTAVGQAALYTNGSGNTNTAVGRNAAYTNGSGANNVAVGNGAMYKNSTGSSNTIVGVNAGYGAAGGANISSNVFVGKEAGTAIATGGDNNVCVGTMACDALTTGDQNIIIGHNVDAPTATANGQIVIGNLIYGTTATGTGTTVSTSGKVGIGTNAPTKQLDVVGTLNISQAYTVTMTSDDDAVVQVGMIVVADDDNDFRFKKADNSTDTPIGIYDCRDTGCGETAVSTSYQIAVGGLAYVAPIEDHADVVRGDVVYAQNDAAGYAGYAEFSATIGGANHNAEVGHALYAEAKDAFNGAADVDPDTDAIANVSSAWAVGDPVIFWNSGDTEPTGLTDGKVYFIKTNATGTVTLCATKGCSTAVDITADGSGTTMYLQRLPLCMIHWN